MKIDLTILTLNIWGIPFISKDKSIRVKAIADELVKGDFDVVSLQEVWSNADYEYIKNATNTALPFSYYFHSGVAGSGLCIFSKYPIVTTLFHAWSVNGYIHRIQHGDWFGGKGVGLCKILVGGETVNIYIAHLHAEYDRLSDDYSAHRIIQAFDTAQFIESTRGDSILQVLAGDLNTEPGDLAYRVLLSCSKLKDTYNVELGNIATNECIKNTYTSAISKKKAPNGKRIDYIWHRPGIGYESNVLEYTLPLPQYIPSTQISFSDHEAVYAKIEINKLPESTTCKKCDDNENDISGNLNECIDMCNEKLTHLESQKTNYLLMTFLLIMILFYVIDMIPPYGLKPVYTVLKVGLSGLILFCILMASLWNSIEINGILAGKLAMEISLQNSLNSADPCLL